MIEHPTANLSADGRRTRILALLEGEGEQAVDTLADRFGVSGMTIRRDLQELTDAGKVIRTHGGAAPASRVSFEFHFLERARRHAQRKHAIAEVAASLIEPGQSVILDSGTTTLAIARLLRTMPGLTVVTTSLPIASELFGVEGLDLILLGGQLRKDSPDLVGAITHQNLELLQADVAFIGADAVDGEGRLYNASPEVGRMLAAMAKAAASVYAVADSSKIGRHRLLRFADAGAWQGLITDDELDAKSRKKLERAGVRVIQATAPKE